jgi:hypothetical protein
VISNCNIGFAAWTIKLFHIATLLYDHQYVLLKLVNFFPFFDPFFLNFHQCYILFSHQNLAQVQFCLFEAFGVFMFQFFSYSHDLNALFQGHYFFFQNLLVWVLIYNAHEFLDFSTFYTFASSNSIVFPYAFDIFNNLHNSRMSLLKPLLQKPMIILFKPISFVQAHVTLNYKCKSLKSYHQLFVPLFPWGAILASQWT